MGLDNYDFYKDGEDWAMKKRGNEKNTKVFKSLNKTEATQQGAAYLKEKGNASLKIRKENGQIQEERTYPRSADPTNSPG
jgi:hypothetical protein